MGCVVAMVEDNVNEHGYSKKRTLLPVATSTLKKKQKLKNTKKKIEGWGVVEKPIRVGVCRGCTRGTSKDLIKSTDNLIIYWYGLHEYNNIHMQQTRPKIRVLYYHMSIECLRNNEWSEFHPEDVNIDNVGPAPSQTEIDMLSVIGIRLV